MRESSRHEQTTSHAGSTKEYVPLASAIALALGLSANEPLPPHLRGQFNLLVTRAVKALADPNWEVRRDHEKDDWVRVDDFLSWAEKTLRGSARFHAGFELLRLQEWAVQRLIRHGLDVRQGTRYWQEASGKDHYGYDVRLMSVDATDQLGEVGRNLVIVALVGTDLHVRILDASGEKVVDKAENELVSGDALTALKQRLTPFPNEASLSNQDKQEIIDKVTSITGHTHHYRYEYEVDNLLHVAWAIEKSSAAAREDRLASRVALEVSDLMNRYRDDTPPSAQWEIAGRLARLTAAVPSGDAEQRLLEEPLRRIRSAGLDH